MKFVCALLACAWLLVAPASARHGTSYANAASPIGTNLAFNPGSEFPYFNQFKSGRGWITLTSGHQDTSEEWFLYQNCLDANGYLLHMTCQITNTTFNVTTGNQGVLSATVAAQGSGYTRGTQTLTVSGGTCSVQPTLTVFIRSEAFVDFGIAVAGLTGGYCSVLPSNPVSVTGGGGTGAQFTLTWGPALLVNSLTTGVGPWLGGTLTGTGIAASTTIVGCPGYNPSASYNPHPGNSCGGTGTYILSQAVSAGQTGITATETQTFVSVSPQSNTLSSCCTTVAPYYPGGSSSWLLIYDGDDNAGASNFTYRQDATLHAGGHSCAAGTCTDILDVTPSTAGIEPNLQVTDPNSNGKYVKNIRLVLASQWNALSAGDKAAISACCTANSTVGVFFNPDFVTLLQGYRTLRTMDWNQIGGVLNGSWNTRSQVNWAFWNDPVKFEAETPVEVHIALANKVHANLWMNSPCMADTNYMTNESTLVLNLLDPKLKFFKQACNELFNQSFVVPLANAMEAAGFGLFTTCSSRFQCIADFGIYNEVRSGDVYHSAWTGSNAARLTRIVGGQNGNNGWNNPVLSQLPNINGGPATWDSGLGGAVSTHVDALATAKYMTPEDFPLAWTADNDGGIQRLYTETVFGGLVPGSYAANCGNGIGFTCGTSTAYTFSLGTIAITAGMPANICYHIIAHASSGASPTFAGDGGTAMPINGALTANTQYKLCLAANGSWNIAASWPTGNCGSGILTTCGGATAFTLTTGLGLSGTPANGTCINFFANQASSGSPTLAVDSVAAVPLIWNYQLSLRTPYALSTNTLYQACYTTATSAGAVTAAWAVLLLKSPDSTGSALQTLTVYSQMDKHWANTYSVGWVGYEGGQGFFVPNYDSTAWNLALAIQSSWQMRVEYQLLLEMVHAAGMTEFLHYNDTAPWSQFGGGYWGFTSGTYAAGNPTARQQGLSDFIRRTPCWWAGC